MITEELRKQLHQGICQEILSLNEQGIPNNADKHSQLSVRLAKGIIEEIGIPVKAPRISGQTAGKLFENHIARYLKRTFSYLQHLRPGDWEFAIEQPIELFEQYEHLKELEETLKFHQELRATLGDYLVNPDILIGRKPVSDEEINKNDALVSTIFPALTPLCKHNSNSLILHASISCKWTIRSDRSQNARTEALNLIRNRKGKTPHIVIVTAEPYPQRIASLALGTGDVDCVYHFALNELREAAKKIGNQAITDMLDLLISGKRLRDISDLPFDLVI